MIGDDNYVVWMAKLGQGDQHPGGPIASELLQGWIEPWLPGQVVEIGPGVGLNAVRLGARGWKVTVVEPNPALRAECATRGLRALDGTAETLSRQLFGGAPDVVVAETVLAVTDLRQAFQGISSVLRPGGALAFCDMVWSESVAPADAARIHDDSLGRFGIPVATRERWTWADWKQMLSDAGLTLTAAVRAPVARTSPVRSRALRAPLTALRVRLAHVGQVHCPPDSLEGWCGLAIKKQP